MYEGFKATRAFAKGMVVELSGIKPEAGANSPGPQGFALKKILPQWQFVTNLELNTNKMQRTIILMRHAKSSWATPGERDIDRPLNQRGMDAAPIMAERLMRKGINIDIIVSSNALRAMQTAQLVMQTFKTSTIYYDSNLYHASAETINEVIASLPPEALTVLIVCHNPGITYWANLQDGNLTENMPTAAMVAFGCDIKYWHLYPDVAKTLLLYDFPKNTKKC